MLKINLLQQIKKGSLFIFKRVAFPKRQKTQKATVRPRARV